MDRTSNGGFTLLEISVALAVLAVGLVTCLQIFSRSLRLQDVASRESRAVLFARGAMDALLYSPELADHSEERVTAEGYRLRVLVRHANKEDGIDEKDLEVNSDVSLRRLQVEVAWQDGIGAKTYTLNGLRAAPESE